jgi:hypothetical protein
VHLARPILTTFLRGQASSSTPVETSQLRSWKRATFHLIFKKKKNNQNNTLINFALQIKSRVYLAFYSHGSSIYKSPRKKNDEQKCLFPSSMASCARPKHRTNLSTSQIRASDLPTQLNSPFLQNKLAPPLSIASISASLYTVRLNLTGNSLRSQNSPSFGCTLPNCLAVLPPIPPSAWETEGACEAPLLLLERIMGPCWLAFWR